MRTNPIDHIVVRDAVKVELHGSGGLSDVATMVFDNHAEALAYAERISTHYGVEIKELQTPQDEPDFAFRDFGSVWTITAISDGAKAFAEASLPVEGWQGVPTSFSTDHRAAAALAEQLGNEGWSIEVVR